ncbi:MAG: hypothetical protein U9O83_06265 [Campylobacterota bacterium]|nr:hypothetical protein [Campylobacterota bacterium]
MAHSISAFTADEVNAKVTARLEELSKMLKKFYHSKEKQWQQ